MALAVLEPQPHQMRHSNWGVLRWQRAVIATVASGWTELAGVAPRVSWWSEIPEVKFSNIDTFGVLATQLLFAVVGTSSQILQTCFHCGEPISRKCRRPWHAARRRSESGPLTAT
jgi:hypothetical protein